MGREFDMLAVDHAPALPAGSHEALSIENSTGRQRQEEGKKSVRLLVCWLPVPITVALPQQQWLISVAVCFNFKFFFILPYSTLFLTHVYTS